MKKRVLTVIGTRPEIIKMAALIPLLDEQFEHKVLHSGQHYSSNMDEVFFADLKLRKPDHTLNVGSLPPATQVGRIMEGVEKVLAEFKPHAVVVQGDTNTTLAGALAVAKNRAPKTKLVHIEALVRSYNLYQAEEINRRLVDSVSDLLFLIRETDLANAKLEGIDPQKCFVFGNTLSDSCLRTARLANTDILKRHQLDEKKYVLATCHRQETVDSPELLEAVLRAFQKIAEKTPVIFPVHPRTAKQIESLSHSNWKHPQLKLIEPVGYTDTISLLKNSMLCITDSGGVLEEAAVLRIPTLIIRNEVEQKYFVDAGIHELVPPGFESILKAARALIENPKELQRRAAVPLELATQVPQKIVETLLKHLSF